ncbi:MAG: DUF4249 domain-containing protein [Muribaculaceae bacterium]|nr:DUF4249 domain-containing protein [Muribaculaceae bacterium]
MSLTLLLTGCYEDFVPDIDTTPVLCINSLITAGQPIEVKVSRTWLYTEENADIDHSVADASVKITVNGELKGSDYIAREGDNIMISAESPTYGEAHAEVKVPYAPDAELLRWTPTLNGYWHNDNNNYKMTAEILFNLAAELQIKDDPREDNFYRFSYLGYFHSYSGDNGFDDILEMPYPPEANFDLGKFQTEMEPIFSEHISVLEYITSGGSYGFSFFTDRQFTGKSYTLNLQFSDCQYEVQAKEWSPELLDCGYTFTIHSISRSYYEWANYEWQRDEGIMMDLSEIGFNDPIWGYSNVSTGAGVVAAQAMTTVTLPLTSFLDSVIRQEK